jgi:hypothetical protein
MTAVSDGSVATAILPSSKDVLRHYCLSLSSHLLIPRERSVHPNRHLNYFAVFEIKLKILVFYF